MTTSTSSIYMRRMQHEISELREIMTGSAVVAHIVSDNEDDGHDDESSEENEKKRVYTRWAVIFLGVLLLIAVVVVIVVVSINASTRPAESSPPTDDIEDLLVSKSSDGGQAMRTPSTPQYKAFQWLNGNANLKSYSDEQKVQRYVLATLYYSTGGDDWKSNDLWLDHGDECGRWWQEIGGNLSVQQMELSEVSDFISTTLSGAYLLNCHGCPTL